MSEAATSTPDVPLTLPRRVVGVQFRRAAAMIYDFDAADLSLTHDTRVIVETERGEAIGWTVGEPEDRDPHQEGVLRKIIRVAADTDHARQTDLQTREKEALRFCARKSRELGLPMKIIAVEWAHSGEKAAFYFSSEERIDFRTLVRDLAQHFRVRVEMRQVGPRDEAKIIGAMGPCGRETCCSSWMRAFTPVSIKMAKDQGLSITPAKVTGVCGRLLCCLAYEQDTYRDLRRKLPKYGKQVMTPRGPGRIVDVLVLRERVRVALDGESAWVDFAATEVKPLGVASVAEEAEPEIDAALSSDEIPAESPAVAHVEKPRQSAPAPATGAPRAESPGRSSAGQDRSQLRKHGHESQRRVEPSSSAPAGQPQRARDTAHGRPQRPHEKARPQHERPDRPNRPQRQDAQRQGEQRHGEQRHPERPPPQDAQRHGKPERSDRSPQQRDGQRQRQHRPDRPPRPPETPGPVTVAGPPVTAQSQPAPKEGAPPGAPEPVDQGRSSRHRNRRRRGGGGGQGSGGQEPGGGAGPAGP